jgi:hypothetical protein
MSNKTKKRPKKKYVPKGTCDNPLGILGGMGSAHHGHLRKVQGLNHLALAEITQGRGTREHWNRVTGALNIANVMCEQGIGDEYRHVILAARDALLAVGKRAVLNNDRFVFTGDELKAVNEAMDVHDAQLENSRAVDIDKAADEVERRLRHRINSTSVKRELQKTAAPQA